MSLATCQGHCRTGAVQVCKYHAFGKGNLARHWRSQPVFHFIAAAILTVVPSHRSSQLAPMYYRNAHCAVVVYDVTQPQSLEKAKSWIKELQRQADPNIVIALAGNKVDLAATRRGVPKEVSGR